MENNSKKPTRAELKLFHDLIMQYKMSDFVDAVCYQTDKTLIQLAADIDCYPSAISSWKRNEPSIIERMRKITAIPFNQ